MSRPISSPSDDSSPRRCRLPGKLHQVLAPPQGLLHPILALVLSPVAAIKPQVREAWEHLSGVFEEDLDPLVVHHLRAMDPRFQHQTLGVHEQMTLSALHLLASVVTALIASYAGALD